MLLSCIASFGGCSGGKDHYLSPDGRREVVIETARASIDTIRTVSVRYTKIFGNSQDIGCFTDDDPESALPTGATWPSAEEFAIATAADDVPVRAKLGAGGQWAVVQAPDNFLSPCPYS